MQKLIILILVSSFCSCRIKEPINPISFYTSIAIDSTKIRYDGFYTNLCLDSLKNNSIDYRNVTAVDMVIFNRNSKIRSDYYGAIKGNEPFTCRYYEDIVKIRKEKKILYFGNFSIKNDSIYAYVPIYLALTGHRFVQLNFIYKGYLKSKDTIVDWRVIKPYPGNITKVAIKLNPRLFQAQSLYFVKTDAVKCLIMNQ